MRRQYWLLMTGAFIIAACTESSAPEQGQQLSTGRLSGHSYTIANGAELAGNLAVPTTKLADKPAASSGGGNANFPASVVFNEDGTFKMTYADGSYFVGGWKIEQGKLVLSIAGDTAMFDVQFPSAESIALVLQNAAFGSAGGPSFITPPVGAVDTNAELIGGATYTEFLAMTKGTWCYESGSMNVNDDAIASFMQLGADEIHVLLFESSDAESYGKAELNGVNPDGSFTLSYYHPLSKLQPKFSVHDAGTMTIAYAPLKKTQLRKVADDEVKCPDLPKAVMPGNPQMDSEQAKIFAKAKGTWCFKSGHSDKKANTVASVRFKDVSAFDVLLFPLIAKQGYVPVKESKWYPNEMFEMNYYTPFAADKVDHFAVNGDVMKVHYESGKDAELVKISSDPTTCPAL